MRRAEPGLSGAAEHAPRPSCPSPRNGGSGRPRCRAHLRTPPSTPSLTERAADGSAHGLPEERNLLPQAQKGPPGDLMPQGQACEESSSLAYSAMREPLAGENGCCKGSRVLSLWETRYGGCSWQWSVM